MTLPNIIYANLSMSPIDHNEAILSGTLQLEACEIAATQPYILATSTVLAADPAVKALVAEAVAEERERCVMAARLAMVNNPQADEFTCSICATSIRGETP